MMRSLPVVAVAVALALLGCGGTPAGGTPLSAAERAARAARVIVASAPAGVGVEQLGTPYDADFHPLSGEDGATLFPGAGAPRKQTVNRVQHEYLVVETEEALAANAAGWGFTEGARVSGGRHASYRALKIAYSQEIDDTSGMRHPPDAAVYYLSRIYFGHGYEAVLSGNERDFHALLRAELAGMKGSLAEFASSHGLKLKAVGRGLRPRKAQAVFARTPEQIEQAYEEDGPSVPVLVEFRQIASRVGRSGVIGWPKPVRVELTLLHLVVEQEGTGSGTRWTLSLTCQTGDKPLPLPEPLVWSGRAESGGHYVINKSWHVDLFPGDAFECGVGGIGGERALPVAWMQQPVSVSEVMQEIGSIQSPDPSVAYRIDFSAKSVEPEAEPRPGDR